MYVGLLEDDVAIQEMLQLVLQDAGHTVIIFPTAEACMATLEQSPAAALPDLLIVDWRLSGTITGIEVIQKIRTIPYLRTLPIILTTAAAFSDTEALQDLQISFLEKPFSVDDMIALVKHLTQP